MCGRRDTINYVFGFPRIYHQSVIDQVRHGDDTSLTTMVSLTHNLKRWRKVSQSRPSWKSRKPPLEAEEAWVKLFVTARLLQLHGKPHVLPAAKSVEVILRLHASCNTGARVGLNEAASELKELLSQWPVRICPTLDLTSFQMWLGAVTSDRGSEAREWFVNTLRKAADETQQQWVPGLGLLEKEFAQDGPEFSMRLKEVREEVFRAPCI